MKSIKWLLVLVLLLSGFFTIKNYVYSTTQPSEDLTEIPLEGNPRNIAINPYTDQAVVSSTKPNELSIIALDTGQITTAIQLKNNPFGLAVDSTLNLALVSHKANHRLSVIDLNTYQCRAELSVGKSPCNVAVYEADSGPHLGLTANNGSNTVSVIDLQTFKVTKTIQVGRGPRDVAVDPELELALVVNENNHNVSVIDLRSFQVTGWIPVGRYPRAISINPETHLAAVANGKDNFISVINLTNWQTQAITVDKNPLDVAINPLDNRALLVCNKSHSLHLIDLDTFSTIQKYSINKQTRGMAIDPFTNTAVVVDDKTESLTLIQLPNPVPETLSISPNRVSRGSLGTKLAVEGAGFIKTSTVAFQPALSTTLPITFVDNHHLEINLPSTLFNQAGTFQVTVNNPTPEGGTSTAKTLQIENPVPNITVLDPASADSGGPGLTLTVHGSGFFPETTISVNGLSRSSTYINGTELKVSLAAEDLATARSLEITASNPPPGGGVSGSLSFLVTQSSNFQPLPEGSYGKMYEDLIPPNATVTNYDPKRFSLITGLVKDASWNPLSGVTVGIHSGPEYGTAQTDDSGRFSLPVDGGGTVTIIYQKSGFITAHRQVNIGWNTIATAETIVMIPEDITATAITFDGNASTILTHRSTHITDSFGSRSLTMVFTGDNRAWVKDSQGIDQPVTNITVRATEYPTPESMPAKLPPTSAFTYCAELSVDNAKNVRFEKPVVVYVDNFLGFNVGEIVPVGYYDRDRAVWVPENNGKVVRLLDTNGDGIVDSFTDGQNQYPAPGLTDPKQFPPNANFWRVEHNHFSPADYNWPYGFPGDAIEPNPEGEPVADTECHDDDCTEAGSYVKNRSRIFHEDIPIPGMDIRLHYASNRVKGYKSGVSIPASGANVSASLKHIIVKMEVAGRTFQTTLPSSPNQKVDYVWDGLDYLGRQVAGTTLANISIGFVYPGVYYSARGDYLQSFAQTGVRVTGIAGRQEIISWKVKTLPIYQNGNTNLAEGWSISSHHYMNPANPTILQKGDGGTIKNDTRIISNFAGNGQYGYSGDGGPANQASLTWVFGIKTDKAGNVYIADDDNYRVRKVDTLGIITTIAGNGQYNYSGDGGPAIAAGIIGINDIAVDRAGNIFIADSGRIRKVDSSGIITTVAGNGQYGYSGDGGPAIQASLGSPRSLAVDDQGNLYIAADAKIRKVDPNGIITTIAGNGYVSYSGDGGPATQAAIGIPLSITMDNQGNLYIADLLSNRIRRVGSNGIITTIAGNGGCGYSGDGGLATQAGICLPFGVAVDNQNNVYIADMWDRRILKVDPTGIITTITGNGFDGHGGDGGPATEASLYRPYCLTVSSENDLYVGDFNRVRKVSLLKPIIFFSNPSDIFFSDPKGQGYVLSNTGLHKSTIDLETGKTLRTFGYDTENKLVSITDRFGNQTTIQRDGSGVPFSITSPDGMVTRLTIDGNNHLTAVTYPDNSSYSFIYTSDGLMTDKYDPRNNRFQHVFNPNGLITEVSDPEGGSWTYSRSVDTSGTATVTMQTAEGNTTTYRDRTYSTGAYVSTTTSPFGSMSNFTRSSDGLTETEQSSCGMNQIMKYDIDPVFKYKYLKEFTQRSPAGLTRSTTDNRSYQDTNADTIPDRITKTLGINGKNWISNNDTLTGNLTSTSPLGRTITQTYNPLSLLRQNITVMGLLPVSYYYDSRGRLVSTTTGSRTSAITYDPQGNIESLVTPDGKTLRNTYDSVGRLKTQALPDNSMIVYDYDPNGNMTILTTPQGTNYGFDYTGVNLRKTMTMPISGNYQYFYDKERNLKSILFPSGKQIINTAAAGLVQTTATPEGAIHYTYNCSSLLGEATRGTEKVSYGYNGSLLTSDTRTGLLNQAIGYTYNNDFRLASMSYGGISQPFTYDYDGLLTGAGVFTITRNAQNGLPESITDGALNIARTFSNYGELDRLLYTVGGSNKYNYDLTRDLAGRIVRKVETIDGAIDTYDYTYDNNGRLAEVKKNNIVVEAYSYDVNGNRIMETNVFKGLTNRLYTFSAEDHLISAGPETYQFDLDGFLTRRTTLSGTMTTSYSSKGELLSATLPNGTVITYDHDPMGRRIAKRVNGTITEKYLWANLTTLLAVYDSSGILIMRFTYADGRMPVSMTYNGSTYYLIYDQVGSLKAVADATGNIIKRIDYDSFGSIINETNLALRIPFGFAGGLQDRDTNLVRFGARDYDPALGRWTAKDPINFGGGDTNLYGYVMNDPGNMIDPVGLYCGSGISEYFVPDSWWGQYNFSNACKKHDDCYDTCGKKKTECDKDFQKDMLQECSKLKGYWWQDCSATSSIYYQVVDKFGGPAYKSAQDIYLNR